MIKADEIDSIHVYYAEYDGSTIDADYIVFSEIKQLNEALSGF
jgi:hypothetical protein